MTTIPSPAKAPAALAPVLRRRSFLPAAVTIGLIGLVFSPIDASLRAAIAKAHPHLPDAHLWLVQPTVIQVHVLAAVAAVALGSVLMLARKGVRLHRLFGWGWVVLMALVAGSSLFIVGLNGRHWSPIHALSAITLMGLPLAVLAARRHDVKRHRRGMMRLFFIGPVVAGLFAFVPGRLMWNLLFG